MALFRSECSSSRAGTGGWSCHQRGIAAATDPKVGWHWRGALNLLEGAESALFLVKTQSMGRALLALQKLTDAALHGSRAS